jgi:hypothetical protein
MSKHDLKSRPIYHHMPESIDTHLSIQIRVGQHIV